ncbi:right-handed parallel beta-helix repeat-containing protein, partial [Microvirga puerhi]
MTFPTASTTGLPAGVTLTASGDIVVTKAGTVLSNLDVHGQIWVRAENVTIQNCKITSSDYYGVRIDQGLKGVTVKNCDIDGTGQVLNGIGGAGTFLNNNIHGCENGINVEGNVATKIEGNYIHNFLNSEGGHFDGIQIFGGNSNVEVVHNTIINDGSPNGVSAVFVANTFGAVDKVNIHDNYLSSPGNYPIYNLGTYTNSPITNVTWANNYVPKGYYGYEYIRADSQGHMPTMINNTEIATGLSPDKAPDSYAGGSTPTPTPDPTPTPTPTPTPGDIVGTSGNDTLKGTTGGDVMKGLAGNDTYTVNHSGD